MKSLRQISASLVFSLLAGSAVLTVMSCSCTRDKERDKSKDIHAVRIVTLYESYQYSSEVYTGRRIKTTLAANTYQVQGTSLLWYAKDEDGVPDIRFELRLEERPDQLPTKTIEVIGTCKGMVSNAPLAPGYCVVVDDCDISVITQ